MEWVALAAVLILGGALAYSLRTGNRDRDTYLRAVSLSIEAGKSEREALLSRISEMATRIQHPEMPRPDLHAVEEHGPAPEPDPEYEKVGQIYPPSDNGETPDEAS